MKPKIRGYQEGVLDEEIRSVGGGKHRKGDVVRWRKYKVYPDKDGYKFSDYEYHVLDIDNYNLIRTTRLKIKGMEIPDLRKEYEKNGRK